MIISQTPYRVSFAGGGSDLPAFYRNEFGAVFSVALGKHMYVTVSPRFDKTVRVAYTKTEITEGLEPLQHELVREALRMADLHEHIEITTIGDLPGGTGMGSSSSLTVGVLNALYAYKGQITSPTQLAREACRIEMDILAKPIGKQDQYAAAVGGLNYMRFNPDDTVDLEPVPCRAETIVELENRMLLMYTAQQRSADTILQKQSDGTADKMNVLREMRDLADTMRRTIAGRGDVDRFAKLLDEGWEMKRSLGFGISEPFIDEWYSDAKKAGAQGGKLLARAAVASYYCMVPPERHEAIREALGRPREIDFNVDRLGSRIIFISDRHDL